MKMDFCEYCAAPLNGSEKLVTVYRHSRGQHFIFQGVPARVCPRCGERYFARSDRAANGSRDEEAASTEPDRTRAAYFPETGWIASARAASTSASRSCASRATTREQPAWTSSFGTATRRSC